MCLKKALDPSRKQRLARSAISWMKYYGSSPLPFHSLKTLLWTYAKENDPVKIVEMRTILEDQYKLLEAVRKFEGLPLYENVGWSGTSNHNENET